LFYYPNIAGKETLPVPHELQEGKSVKDIEEMPVEARKARLLYFWLGRSGSPSPATTAFSSILLVIDTCD